MFYFLVRRELNVMIRLSKLSIKLIPLFSKVVLYSIQPNGYRVYPFLIRNYKRREKRLLVCLKFSVEFSLLFDFLC
ncbi:hypothetical protein ATE84_3853 [Aquimarina sp. MAR_2010_214]|nr:hypothetical protein ATE84_3853 [Aquimarina sp. MAR_2010_214]